jgi:3-hydroxy acid dehydrogenase / malonic semialdehyde reductase
MITLKDKIVFITGASLGIGRSCAYTCAALGAHLIISSRRREAVELVAEDIRSRHAVRVLGLELDVRDRQAVTNAIASLPEEWRSVDILINNAGLVRGLDPLWLGDFDDWDQMIDTNVKGLLYVARALVPGMLERNGGHVINIGSIAGQEAYPKGSVYNATKFAVDAITKALRMELVDTPLRVSTVDPGLVETNFSVTRFYGDEERAKKVYEGLQPCSPDDVADAVVYCATRPPHISINQIVLMPTAQASATIVHREPG